ncbi:MAG: hypothetical protein ACI8W8_001534 [Rhodothermales bacterium]
MRGELREVQQEQQEQKEVEAAAEEAELLLSAGALPGHRWMEALLRRRACGA